jgi:hypothetical protein
MDLQHTPFNGEETLAHALTEIERAIAETDRSDETPREATAPGYGEQYRSAVAACADGIVNDLVEKIQSLRRVLDQMEREVLQSAARSKHAFNGQVTLSGHFNNELLHLQGVVARLAGQSRADAA